MKMSSETETSQTRLANFLTELRSGKNVYHTMAGSHYHHLPSVNITVHVTLAFYIQNISCTLMTGHCYSCKERDRSLNMIPEHALGRRTSSGPMASLDR